MSGYFAAARAAIEAFGGVVEKFIGDAVVGVFGVPAAHEDDPERAVRAGLRIVEAVEGLTRPDGSPLQLRVGVNTGEALVRLDVDPGLRGGVPDRRRGQHRRADPVRRPGDGGGGRAGDVRGDQAGVRLRELPRADAVKGKSEPVAVWQAVAPLARFGTDITRRHDTPLVGREIDLALLKGVFDKTVAASSPQLVTIVGEPGLGKSRLVAELFAHVDALPELVTWRQGRCLPYGEGITFWALGEIVKAHAGIFDTDAADVALSRSWTRSCPTVDERAWLKQRLLPLLGIEASSPAEQGGAVHRVAAVPRAHRRDRSDGAGVRGPALGRPGPAGLPRAPGRARAQEVPLLIVATARPELYDTAPGLRARPAQHHHHQPHPADRGRDHSAGRRAAANVRSAGRPAAPAGGPSRGQPACSPRSTSGCSRTRT